MKKLLSILLVCTMLFTLATTVSASKRGGLAGYVPLVKEGETITIDGTMDAAYANALAINLYVPDGRYTAETGTTGTAYLLWSEGKFYVFAKVLDADVVPATPELQEKSSWNTDSFEIFFDLDNEQTMPILQYRVDYSGFGTHFIDDESVSVRGEEAKSHFEHAAKWTNDGYSVELCVDLSKYADIEENMEIGINMLINDMTAAKASDRTAIYYMPSKIEVRDWWKDCWDYVILGDSFEIDNSAITQPIETEEVTEEVTEPVTEATEEVTEEATEPVTEETEEETEEATEEATEEDTTKADTKDEEPVKEGGISPIVWVVIAVVVVAAVVAGVVIAKKKKN